MATAMDLSIGKKITSNVSAVDLRLRPSESSSTRSLTVSPVDSPSSCSSVSPPDTMPVLVSSCSLVSPQPARPLLRLPTSNGLPTMVQYVAAAAQASSLGLASLSRLGANVGGSTGGSLLKKSSKMDNHNLTNSSHVNNNNNSRNSSGHISPNQLRSQRQSQKKSAVWQWFHHPRRQDGLVDEHHTKCMLCETELAFNSSGTTTTMLNHLKSRHDNEVNIEREMAIVRAMRMEKKIAKRGSAKVAETLIIHKTAAHQSFATNFNNNNNSNITNNNNISKNPPESASSQAAQDAALVKKALQKAQRSLEKQNNCGVFAASNNYHHQPSLSCSSDSEHSSTITAGNTTVRQLLHKKKYSANESDEAAIPVAAATLRLVNSSSFDQQEKCLSSTTTTDSMPLSPRGANSLLATLNLHDTPPPHLMAIQKSHHPTPLVAPLRLTPPTAVNDDEPLAKRSRKRKATPKQILPNNGAAASIRHKYDVADEVGSFDDKQSQEGSVDDGVDQEAFVDALIVFLCKDLYSAGVFQQEGMQLLLGTLAPQCVIPDAAELISQMTQRVAVGRQKFASRLTCDSSMLVAAASVELWSATRQVLATITFHLLGEQFEGPFSVNMKTEECMKPNVLVINQVLACCEMLDLCDGRRPQQEILLVTNDATRLMEELEFCRQSEQHTDNDMSMDAPKLLILSCFVSALDHILRAAVAPPKVRALLEKYPDFFHCLSAEHSVLRPDCEPLGVWRRLRNLLRSGTCIEQQFLTILKNTELLLDETLSGRLPLATALRQLRDQEFVIVENEEEEVTLFKVAALAKLNDLYPKKGRISELLAAAEALRRPFRIMEDSEALLAELLRQGVSLEEATIEITSFIKAFCLQNAHTLDARWWQNDDHVNSWPNLAQLARRVLPLPVNCQRLPAHLEPRRACLDKCGATLDAILALRENIDITSYCR